MRDEIFKKYRDISSFTFDYEVTEVFDDMVLRSVPGYKLMIELVGLMSRIYVKPNSNIYDLGCSTGSVTKTILENSNCNDIKIYAVDSSKDMIKKCKKNLKKDCSKINFINQSIEDLKIKNASMVVMNLTLQFIKPSVRQIVINKIFEAMNQGGVLVISEKILENNQLLGRQFHNLHERFKKENGYSSLEIAQKRTSLENYLVSDDEKKHIHRLKCAGFKSVLKLMQCINFGTFIAIK